MSVVKEYLILCVNKVNPGLEERSVVLNRIAKREGKGALNHPRFYTTLRFTQRLLLKICCYLTLPLLELS